MSLTVCADEVAEIAVDAGGFLDSAVEHCAPLAGILVEIDGAEEITGLENDFQRVAEVMRKAAQLLGVLKGDWRCADGVSHSIDPLGGGLDLDATRKVRIATAVATGSMKIHKSALTRMAPFVTLGIAASPAVRAGHNVRAEVAELADAHGSGPCTRKGVGVRVPSSAPKYHLCY
jgi:hypothetical protein